MRRVPQLLVRLYPASWRARYGEEFATLIEDSSPGWRGAFDLLKGAIRMQMHVPAFPKLAVILSLTGMVAGFGVSWLMTPVYASQAEMELSPAVAVSPEVRQRLAERVIQMEQEVLSRTTLSRTIQNPRLDLYKRARARMPLEDVIEGMRTRDIMIRIVPSEKEKVRFFIQFIYPDPVKARDTLQALLNRFLDANVDTNAQADAQRARPYREIDYLEARVAELEKRLGIPSRHLVRSDELAQAGENLGVLEAPSLPTRPAKPNREIFAASGFGAGFAAAVVIAVFRRRAPAIPFPAQTA